MCLSAISHLGRHSLKLYHPLVQVHVDVGKKCEVYYQLANYMISAGYSYTEDVISIKHFYKLWKSEFWWLKTRQTKTIMNKCKVCEDLEVGVGLIWGHSCAMSYPVLSAFHALRCQNHAKHERDPKVLSLLRHYQYEHRVFQQSERECYYSKRMLAQKEPKKYMSMICDGMQQATCALPSKVCSIPSRCPPFITTIITTTAITYYS